MSITELLIVMSIELTSSTVTVMIHLIGTIAAVVSVIFVGIQLKQKVKSDHAKYVAEMMDKTRSNPAMLELFSLLDYQKFEYDIKFHGSEIERTVDNLLHHYEYIIYLKKTKMLKKDEFGFFEYNIQRVIGDYQIQNYLFNLYHFVNTGNLSFKYKRLFEYGEENELINPTEFERKDSHKYKKVLNF